MGFDGVVVSHLRAGGAGRSSATSSPGWSRVARDAASPGDAKGIDIIVSDNGPGMPEAVVAVTKGQQAGTQSGGIGLALARQLVAAHGGTMAVMSEKGQGTLVRVRPA